MKSALVVCLLTIFSINCTEVAPNVECQKKAEEFNSLTSGYFRGCVQTCFNASGKLAPSKINESKTICEQECRSSIPFSEINKLKETINSVYNCRLNYNRSL